MNRLLLLVAASLLSSCATPPPEPAAPKEPGMFVTTSEAQQCADGDGCLLVTKAEIRKKIVEAYEAGEKSGKEDAKGECWANTSWKR